MFSAVVVTACIVLAVFNVSVFWILYYVFDLDVVPLAFATSLHIMFSMIVLHVLYESEKKYEEDKLAFYVEKVKNKGAYDIFVCLNAACNAFFDFRYKYGNLGIFTFPMGNYTCFIRLKRGKLRVWVRNSVSYESAKILHCNFDKNMQKFYVEIPELASWTEQIKYMESIRNEYTKHEHENSCRQIDWEERNHGKEDQRTAPTDGATRAARYWKAHG